MKPLSGYAKKMGERDFLALADLVREYGLEVVLGAAEEAAEG